ncbi:alkaline shock response membrane anchor protein AmaP [Streptomyces sp. CRN 30]|uniref:alkaline shock response membrane anchor protein AmaP n=1 Tax=Streptomyces sp. CRN 30 TaxID=3075613 RepID=UPI002A7F7F1F|nr:alkaline shock response membrane anchor protein AmaP [Streptomyces sp. CRN 30]
MRTVDRIVNRVLLGLGGLLLVVAGGSVLAVGLGVRPPSWWVYGGRHDVLLDDAARTRWRDAGWWWPAVIAGLAVLLLLALWWLAAVLRRRRLGALLVDTGDGRDAVLHGPALEEALAAEAERAPGVERVQVRLTGRRRAPGARVRILLEPHAHPREVLDGLAGRTLGHARDSAGRAALPTEVRLRAAGHRAERVN